MAKSILKELGLSKPEYDSENEEDKKQNAETFMNELKAAAFESLLLNPGTEQGGWTSKLEEIYGIEVVDALGNDPNEVFADLAELWEYVYLDPVTGIEKSFSDWAITFCDEQTRDLYYELVEAKKRTKAIFKRSTRARNLSTE